VDKTNLYIIELDKIYLFEQSYQIIIDDISDIQGVNLDLLYDEYLKIKDLSNNLLSDLNKIKGRFCKKNKTVIYFIKTFVFEIDDISKLSYGLINEKYVSHLKKLNELLQSSNYKEYIESIPEELRVYTFLKFTKKPPKGSLYYHWRNGKELWELEDKKYWEFVRFLWTNYSESVWSNRQYWLEIFTNSRNEKEYFMNLEERQFLENLPDEFEVFRGYPRSKPTEKMKPENLRFWEIQWFGDMGFSYTLSKDIGLKYLDKYKIYNHKFEDTDYYKIESDLYHGLIKKSDVLFFFNGKEEKEVIIVKTHGHYVF
jgi:hypothetical protein